MEWIVGWGDGLMGPTTAGCGAVFCGGVDWEFVPISYGRETIALVPQQRGENGLKAMHKHAKLIAAAPELLESLKIMHQHVLELCFTHGTPLPEASIEKSSAAIKKATE